MLPQPNPAFVRPSADRTRPDLQGTFGMTASTHWIATATAQSVLERGGNAFDAAVAGAFVIKNNQKIKRLNIATKNQNI